MDEGQLLLLWPGEMRRKGEGDFGQIGPALLAGTNNSAQSIKEITSTSYKNGLDINTFGPPTGAPMAKILISGCTVGTHWPLEINVFGLWAAEINKNERNQQFGCDQMKRSLAYFDNSRAPKLKIFAKFG